MALGASVNTSFFAKKSAKTGSKTGPKTGPFSEPCFLKLLLVGSRYKTLPNHPVTNFLEKWVPIWGPILNKIVKKRATGISFFGSGTGPI